MIILLAFYVYGCKYNKNNSIIQICVTHFCIINAIDVKDYFIVSLRIDAHDAYDLPFADFVTLQLKSRGSGDESGT